MYLMVVSILRIIFGILLTIKLYHSFRASKLLWSFRKPNWLSDTVFNGLQYLLLISTICFTAGLFTGYSAILQYFLFVYLFFYVSLYGVEDVLFTVLCGYFTLAGSGHYLSLDSLLGISRLGRFTGATVLPEIFLLIALGIIFLSAGIDKLFRPIWRSGIAVYYFLVMPQHSRWDLSVYVPNKKIILFLSYMVILGEIFFLPLALLLSPRWGIYVWVPVIGLAITLIVVVPLRWIGENLLVGLILTVLPALRLFSHEGNLAGYAISKSLQLSQGDQLLLTFLGLSLFAGLWSSCLKQSKRLTEIPDRGVIFRKFDQMLCYLARFTLGFPGPFELFTEEHLQAPVIYRTLVKAEENDWNEIHRIYTEDGHIGPSQFFQPRFELRSALKVSDLCERVQARGEIPEGLDRKFLLNLIEYIVDNYSNQRSESIRKVRLLVAQVKPPDNYDPSHEWNVRDNWTDFLEVDFKEGYPSTISVLTTEPLKHETGRSKEKTRLKFSSET